MKTIFSGPEAMKKKRKNVREMKRKSNMTTISTTTFSGPKPWQEQRHVRYAT